MANPPRRHRDVSRDEEKQTTMTADLAWLSLPMGTLGATRIQVSPWSANPVIDGLKAKNPDLFALAVKVDGPPPTLFESGDLPPFVASGIDPQFLMRLP